MRPAARPSMLFRSVVLGSLVLTAASLELQITDTLQLKVEAWGEHSIRVRIGVQIQKDLLGALDAVPPTTSNKPTETNASVTNGNLEASVDAHTGLLSFKQVHSGAILLRQLSQVFSRDSAVNSSYSAFNISFDSDPEEVIVGFGQRSRTQTQLNNKKATPVIDLGQRKYFISIPFGYSSRGYGFLWNLPGNGQLDMQDDSLDWSASAAYQLDFWVTTAPAPEAGEGYQTGMPTLDPASVMAQYADATGHAPLLPTYAAKFWQSKCRYYTQEKVLEVAQGYADRSLSSALGVLVIDFHSWVYFGDYTFNSKCWPDPSQMTNKLSSMSNGTTRILLSTYPYFDERSNNTAVAIAKGFFSRNASTGEQWPIVANKMCANNACYLIDPFIKEARDWVWELHEHYFQAGIESFWLDDTEPGGGKTEGGKPALTGVSYACGPYEYCGALWPNKWVSVFSEGVQKSGVDKPIMLARAGWAGFQKLGSVLWSSDIKSTFEVLQVQVRAGLATMMSGVPYWTTDIGGFTDGTDSDPYMQELIVRWHQYGAFCPIYRTHGSRKPKCQASDDPHNCTFACGGAGNEAWSYGSVAEQGITTMIRMREAMVPYTLELSIAAAKQGAPPMRPMLYDYPGSEIAWQTDDQFMYGPDVLVAPVLFHGARNRSVWFPPGHWRHMFTNEMVTGPKTALVQAPLLQIPVYERVNGTDGALRILRSWPTSGLVSQLI